MKNKYEFSSGNFPDPGMRQTMRRSRRKEARPTEIIEAASHLFGVKGYSATRLDEVAKRAGVSKGTVYVYFANKEALFRAVAKSAMSSRLDDNKLSPSFDESLAESLEKFIARFIEVDGKENIFHLIRMVISESNNFPDLADIWHDEVVLPMVNLVAGFIKKAQVKGEASPGDPYLMAFSVLGALQMAILHRLTFSKDKYSQINLTFLAKQHIRILLHGLLKS